MLQIVVGWMRRQFGFVPVETVAIQGEDALHSDSIAVSQDASQNGIRFQIDQFQGLFERIGYWETVEFFTARGRSIEGPEDFDRGADGGLDGIIRITAPTDRGAQIVAGKIRMIILKHDY
jgi:hypothetical protein